jgi:ABC-2 type transport system permease protein
MRILVDRQAGISERFNSMPISRGSVLWAHVLTSVVSNLSALLLVFIVAFLIGFRPDAGILEWLGVIGILIILTLALTWISVIPGLKAKSYETAGAYAYPLMFLPFLSSAFVPTETMPKVLRIFAENQPITSIVETMRALLNSQPVGNNIWIALAWCFGIMLVAWAFAMKAYRRTLN